MGGQYGGEEAFGNMMDNNPFNEFPREVYQWFMYSSGIFYGELIRHLLWDERKSDFGEMLIHHLATVFLVFGSAYGNLIGIGAVISWLHLFTDMFIALAKIFSSLKGSFMDTISVINMVCFLLPSWIYLRLLVLPFWIYNLLLNPKAAYPPHISEFDAFLMLNGVYLLVLMILHAYWTVLIVKMLSKYLRTGATKDTQEDFISEDKRQ